MLLFSALGKGEGNVLSVMKKLQNEPQFLKKCSKPGKLLP